MFDSNMRCGVLSALGVSGGTLLLFAQAIGQMTGGNSPVISYPGTAITGVIFAAASLIVGVINALILGLKTRAEQKRLDSESDFQRLKYLDRIERLENSLKETNHAAILAKRLASKIADDLSSLQSRLDTAETLTREFIRQTIKTQATLDHTPIQQ